jgi:hypothetical protein
MLAVPEAPAFSVLGVTPEKVMRPTSGKALAIGLLSGMDPRGNAQAGLAVDTRPWLLAFGDDLTLAQYRSDTLKRQLARIRLSFATSAGQSDEDKANRYGLGLTFTPWDQGDPRMDLALSECYRKHISFPDDDTDVTLPPGADAPREAAEAANDVAHAKPDKEELAVAAKKCVKESQKRNWNAGAWDIGVAGYTATDDGDSTSGGAVWTSLALKVSSWGQFIAHGRLQNNEMVPDATATNGYRTQDSWLAGGRLRLGNDRGSFMVEGTYASVDPNNGDRFDNSYVAAGVEFRVMDDLWLQFAIADTFGDNPDDNSTVISGQLRWGVSEKRLLGLPL